jgi:hypothetical protein
MIWPLQPLAVALQGVGFGPRHVALQGMWPTSPYRRAPLGAGHPPRPTNSVRPVMLNTARPQQHDTTRPRR